MRIAYFSYPYADDPERRRSEAVEIARKIFRECGVFPIVPHVAVDFFADGIPLHELFRAELELIERCDMFILGCETLSKGMAWELAFASKIGKPIYVVEERDGKCVLWPRKHEPTNI